MTPAATELKTHPTNQTNGSNSQTSEPLQRLVPSRTATHRLPSKRSGFVVSWPLAAVLAVGATTVTVQPWQWLRTESHSTGEDVHVAPRVVQIERPTPATTAQVVLPATLRPWQTTTLHARVNGYLAAWHRELGSSVKAGDLLAEIETPELDQELAQGEALVLEATSAVVQAQAERVEAQADLKNAEAQLARMQA